MAHIIILDENGNEIGRSNEGHREPDHEETVVVVNLERVGELLGVKQKDKTDE